jgi:hypothetical protein
MIRSIRTASSRGHGLQADDARVHIANNVVRIEPAEGMTEGCVAELLQNLRFVPQEGEEFLRLLVSYYNGQGLRAYLHD